MARQIALPTELDRGHHWVPPWVTQIMRLLVSPSETPIAEMGRGIIWPLFPLGLGTGIACASTWPQLGLSLHEWIIPIAVLAFFAILWRNGGVVRWVLVLSILVVFGMARTGVEFDNNQTTPFDYRYYGPIEGHVIKIDKSSSDARRITLGDVILDGRKVSGMVRISLHGDFYTDAVQLGTVLQTTGHLGPPSGPTEPGGYDFRRHAWQNGIAAVGYTRNPAIFSMSQQNVNRFAVFRAGLSKHLIDALGVRIGGFAAAIFIGDRSELDRDVVEAMRQSNLAHLIAISGMHIGTVCGLVFGFVIRSSSVIPAAVNSPWPLRVAAIMALIFGAGYWTISGMAYSATRAFLMAVLFFMALASYRRAISLRSVAWVGTAILFVDPFALGDVGFQMSFAATTGLILFFSRAPLYRLRLWSPFKWLIILAFTSLVAGMVTAPFSAYHFNTVPKYGLLANILAVPVMTFVVMPAGIISAVLMPFGWDELPLRIVGWGIEWIIAVGEWVSGFPEPIWTVPRPEPWVFLVIIGAGLLVTLSARGGAIVAALIMVGVIIVWPNGTRPLLLVTDDAKFFGLMSDGTRLYSRGTGHSFAAGMWAGSDGNDFDQHGQVIDATGDPMIVDLDDDWRIVFTTTKKGAELIGAECHNKTLIIAAQANKPIGNCIFYNSRTVTQLGGIAADIQNGELIVTPNIDLSHVPWRHGREQ